MTAPKVFPWSYDKKSTFQMKKKSEKVMDSYLSSPQNECNFHDSLNLSGIMLKPKVGKHRILQLEEMLEEINS